MAGGAGVVAGREIGWEIGMVERAGERRS